MKNRQKIRLAYITNAMLTLNDAQSVQISSMCRAFFVLLKNDFVLRSPYVNSKFELSAWVPAKCFFTRGYARYTEMAIRMFFWLVRVRPEAVFTRDIVLASLAAILGLEVVYEFHKECRTLTHEFLYRVLKKRIKVVAISQALGDFLVHAYKTDPKNLLVAHDAVFLEEYDEVRRRSKEDLREELGLPGDKTIFLHAGSLYPGRGISLFQAVLENYPEVYGLSVGGREEDVLKWEVKYSGYKNMHFVPHQDRNTLIMYQVAADILFFPMTRKNPIWWCTSPMKIFEYMAAGNIILGSNVGSSSEILNGTNMMPFEPENPASIVRGVRKILNNEVNVKELTNKALTDIKNKYTWEIRAERILIFCASQRS